jgi:CRISPR/Cas system-associated exonuclease Cas4 (RecB family)
MTSYNFCPQQAYRQFVLGQDKDPSIVMLMGTRFHEFAHTFFEYGQAVPQEYWHQLIPEEFIPLEVQAAKWWLWFESDRKQRLEAIGRGDEWLPYKMEMQLDSSIFHMTGTIDRIDWVNRDEKYLAIVEYKTGESLSQKKEEQIVLEMAFYAILYSSAHSVGTITQLRLINPRLHIYREYPLTDSLMETVFRKLQKIRKSLTDGVWPYKCEKNDMMYPMCQLCELEEIPGYEEDITASFTEELDILAERAAKVQADMS